MEEWEKDNILSWAEEENAKDLSDFVETVWQAKQGERQITIVCGSHTDTGKLKEFRMIYKEGYPDFDVEIALETSVTQEGYPYSLLFPALTKEQVKREGEKFHIISAEDCEDGYITIS